MLSYQEALAILNLSNCILDTENIQSSGALGRICAKTVMSKVALPSFNNSAMDGFAVIANDVVTATTGNPVLLAIKSVVRAMKQVHFESVVSGICCEIMTGAPIPDGYDAVIPVELVEIEIHNGIRYAKINQAVELNANIRFAGTDIMDNETILIPGQQIKASDIMLLAASGINMVEVYKPLIVDVIASGEEIIDDYDHQLQLGEIYNANSPLLMNLLKHYFLQPRYAGILGDNPDDLIGFIAKSSAPVIIATGAVSKGQWDFIPSTLRSLGANILFHGVAIRPGKPLLFAQLADKRYFFGLPGNPVSTMVGWRFFVIPFLRKILGMEAEKFLSGHLVNKYIKKHSLYTFLKAQMEINQGNVEVTIGQNQESYKIHELTKSNIWAIVEEQQHELLANDLVKFVPLYSDFL